MFIVNQLTLIQVTDEIEIKFNNVDTWFLCKKNIVSFTYDCDCFAWNVF